MPELIVINKSDAADPLVVARLLGREPHAVVASARTGEGIDDVLAAVERDLPRPSVEVCALVPYDRGDLISKIHENGEVLSIDHTADGSQVRVLVNPGLAGELAAYVAAPA